MFQERLGDIMPRALCVTNPAINSTDTQLDFDNDFPKIMLRGHQSTSNNDSRNTSVECCYELEDTDIREIENKLGDGVLTGRCSVTS